MKTSTKVKSASALAVLLALAGGAEYIRTEPYREMQAIIEQIHEVTNDTNEVPTLIVVDSDELISDACPAPGGCSEKKGGPTVSHYNEIRISTSVYKKFNKEQVVWHLTHEYAHLRGASEFYISKAIPPFNYSQSIEFMADLIGADYSNKLGYPCSLKNTAYKFLSMYAGGDKEADEIIKNKDQYVVFDNSDNLNHPNWLARYVIGTEICNKNLKERDK